MNMGVRRPLQMLVGMITTIILGGSMSAVATAMSPTATAKCQPVLGTSSNLVAAGGAGAVTITTQPECALSSVTLSVARDSGAARVGDFTVAGQTFTITQDAAGVARVGNRGDDDAGDDGGGSGRDGGPGKGKDKEKDKDIALEVIR